MNIVGNKKFLSVVLLFSFLFIFLGGISGYTMMLDGVKIRYTSIESYDGTELSILIAEPDKSSERFDDDKYGVVVAHGIISKAESKIHLITELARAGFIVVALDERGHGNSGGSIEKMRVGEKEYEDVTRCAEFLKEDLDCDKVCLVGHSLGGMAVTMASIWAEEKDKVDIAGTVALGTQAGDEDEDRPLSGFFSKTFYAEMKFKNIADEMDENAEPRNYLVIYSEGDTLIDEKKAKKLCNYAGGAGKTNPTDFAIGNASDFYKIESNAPGHSETPEDPRAVKKIIEWIEKSMQLSDHYDFDKDEYKTRMDTQNISFNLARLGFIMLLLPLYVIVNKKILILNKKNQLNEQNIPPEKSQPAVFSNKKEIDQKEILILLGISAGAIFISPLITRLLSIPVLQTYFMINVLVRDLVIAATIIFILIFVLKYETLKDVFNSKNVRKFAISAVAASIILFVFLLGMNLFDTYVSDNNKWQPFTFNPFIPERLLMFISLLIEILFIFGVIEYICRKQIQDNFYNAKTKFNFKTWIKIAGVNGVIKAAFLMLLLIGLFLAYDLEKLGTLLGLIVWIFAFFLILFIILDFLLTAFYQHSKDFWFVNIACYGFIVWYIASCIIRI